MPGSYGVREVQPTGWFDGKDTPGSHGGIVRDRTTASRVPCSTTATMASTTTSANCCLARSAATCRRRTVSIATSTIPRSCSLAFASTCSTPHGNVLNTTLTDANGDYEFTDLAPGEYRVREHQPTDYFDGEERVGTAGGTSTTSAAPTAWSPGSCSVPGSTRSTTTSANTSAPSLSGWVYHDRSDDGSFDRPGEEGIGGVTVELLVNGSATGITRITSTAAGTVGFYEFTNLAPGTYSVREVQPTAYGSTARTLRAARGARPRRMTSSAAFRSPSVTTRVEYNFGELLPGSIRGRVHADEREDCDFDDPDVLLAACGSISWTRAAT